MNKREIQSGLKPEQVTFAEWLCSAPWERSPSTMVELAPQLNVSVATLHAWKKLPEIIKLVNIVSAEKLNSLVPYATALLELAVRKPGSVNRVSFDAAKYIVQDWAKKNILDTDVYKTVKDLYNKYH